MDNNSKVRLWKDMIVGSSEFISKTINESDMLLWGGVSGDINLLQSELEYNKNKRVGYTAIPALYISGLISTAVTKLTFGNIYVTQNLQFVKPIYINDTITAKATIIKLLPEKNMVKIETVCHNQYGELLAEGEAVQYILG